MALTILLQMMYPLLFCFNPFFNWLYMIYGIFTAGQRTWGGPRADAGKADDKTTPEQAVAEAQARGDELNVVPETFRPAVEIARQKSLHTPLMPSRHLEGRFVPAEALPGGWYQQANDSGQLRPDMMPRGDEEMVIYHKGPRRDSTDSFFSSHGTIHTPRRVESIFGEDAAIYNARSEQLRVTLESAVEPERNRMIPAFSNGPLPPESRTRDSSVSSLRSADSDSSVEMHFGVPPRPLIDSARGAQRSAPSAQRRPNVRAPTRQAEQHQRSTSANGFTAPEAAYRPTGRFSHGDQSSAIRTARSPLARKSYTRLATDDAPSTAGTSTEVEVRVPTRASETDDEQPRGRRRRTSVGPDGRRKLSKQPRGSRSSSRA